MGTPEFAVRSLDILYKAGYNIVAVITSPDRMGGRGRKTLIESDVKRYAVGKGLTVLQPKNLKKPEFIEQLRSFNADLQIVVAFRMLPEVVWNMPPLGTYNLHGSLLPKYRGAAPIHWAVINGEEITGVTSFKLKHEIDTGSILMQRTMRIGPDETTGEVHDRMKFLAAQLVLESVQKIENGTAELQSQDDSQVTHAPKLRLENTRLDYQNMSVSQALNFIRGLNPYPLCWFMLGDKMMKVIRAESSNATFIAEDADIISDNKSFISLKCKDGYIRLSEIKYEGKSKMEVGQFLNGFDIAPFAKLVSL
ncbi:MAG: methionyl-tRNA formyltransferase [Saprospiraceae bacterium]|nr:methionyl-tRNA formyltransferase [Saprospiraceae bacterium]